ncbi:chaplin [Streptomyces sp. GC420]|uniref:chaplin n=1 Tax=Streptomyces sp. GC420 TaxID=2697568 RepID=UPI0014151A4F|nr:chaplin [Streptomyces sp. GC420]NBM15632.1 DUF320 domain-containing protein [Streptomyces sp. GC420]
MKRIVKTAAVAASSAALLLFGAGAAAAGDDLGPYDFGPHFSGAYAVGVAAGSPGFLSGNLIQIPVHEQTNVCGNSVGGFHLLNPSFGNACVNG